MCPSSSKTLKQQHFFAIIIFTHFHASHFPPKDVADFAQLENCHCFLCFFWWWDSCRGRKVMWVTSQGMPMTSLSLLVKRVILKLLPMTKSGSLLKRWATLLWRHNKMTTIHKRSLPFCLEICIAVVVVVVTDLKLPKLLHCEKARRSGSDWKTVALLSVIGQRCYWTFSEAWAKQFFRRSSIVEEDIKLAFKSWF